MANYAKALFAGQRFLRQIFDNSNVMLANRYNGNLALLSNCSDYQAILGNKTINEQLCKNLLMQTRSYSKNNSFKQPYYEVEGTRLSKMNGNLAKTGKNTPIVKQSVGKYFDLCGKYKESKKEVQLNREPPKSRQNHAYFMQRTLFNCSTSYDKNKQVENTTETQAVKTIDSKNNSKIKNKRDISDKDLQTEAVRDMPKMSSVHTIFRKNWGRCPSLDSESSRTNLNQVLNCDKYKDLSILCESPSKQDKLTEPSIRREPNAPLLSQNLIRMTHWERKEDLQEELETKGILKLPNKNPDSEVKFKALEVCTKKVEEMKTCPLINEPIKIDAELVINKNKPNNLEESKLHDLNPNEVYAETWTKSKLNSIYKFLNIPDYTTSTTVKAKNEAIYLPELRELNPYEFYDFHANFRPVNTKENEPKSNKKETKNKTVFLKPIAEQPCTGFHCKPQHVEAKQTEEAGDFEVNKKKNTVKKKLSNALKSILFEENQCLSKKLPKTCKIQATYLWVNGNDLSVKDRILTKSPRTVRDLPEWTSYNSDESKNIKPYSDYSLKPKQYYNNPLKANDGGLLILCDTENNKKLSKRASCFQTIKKFIEEEPWFGFAQEYVVLNMDGKPLCLTKARESALAKELAQAHVDACLFAGLPFFAMSEQVVPGKWEYQIGPSFGINAADDLWVSRYLLKCLAEKRNLQVTFDPRCLQKITMDIGTRINFSTESMRKENGIEHIMSAVDRLGDHHSVLSQIYKERRKKRFTWAVGRTNVSVRIPMTTAQNARGYIQDRRPAGDSDPYEISEAIIRVCLEPYENESKA